MHITFLQGATHPLEACGMMGADGRNDWQWVVAWLNAQVGPFAD